MIIIINTDSFIKTDASWSMSIINTAIKFFLLVQSQFLSKVWFCEVTVRNIFSFSVKILRQDQNLTKILILKVKFVKILIIQGQNLCKFWF